MRIDEVEGQPLKIEKIIGIAGGRFNIVHQGHVTGWKMLADMVGAQNAFFVTSENPGTNIFSFEEKKKMAVLAGIPASAIHLVRSPYAPKEVLERFDGETTAALFTVGEKDQKPQDGGRPRFSFAPKKDGSRGYYVPFTDLKQVTEPFSQTGYIVEVPHVTVNVLGQDAGGASELRDQFSKLKSVDEEKRFVADLFGKYDQEVHQILRDKLK